VGLDPVVLCPTGSGVRSFRFSVKPVDPANVFVRSCRPRGGWFRPRASVLAGPDRFTDRCSLPRRGTPVSPVRPPLLRFLVPFSVCRSRCAIRGSQPSDHPASTLDLLATPPEVGCLCERLVPAVFSPCVSRVWPAPQLPHGSRRSDLVMRRGLSFARRSATRGRTLTQLGQISLLCIQSGSARGICSALRSVPCLRVPAFVTLL